MNFRPSIFVILFATQLGASAAYSEVRSGRPVELEHGLVIKTAGPFLNPPIHPNEPPGLFGAPKPQAPKFLETAKPDAPKPFKAPTPEPPKSLETAKPDAPKSFKAPTPEPPKLSDAPTPGLLYNDVLQQWQSQDLTNRTEIHHPLPKTQTDLDIIEGETTTMRDPPPIDTRAKNCPHKDSWGREELDANKCDDKDK